MSKASRITQFVTLWQSFKAQNPTEVLAGPMSFSDFDGLNLDEARETLRFCLETIDALILTDSLKELSFQTIQSIQNQAQGVLNTFTQLVSGRDQGSFQNFAQTLDSFAYHVRMFELPLLTIGSGQLEKTRVQLAGELERLQTTGQEIERLRDDIRTLVAPAVAGSLSQSFTTRRDALKRGRVVLGIAAGIVGAFAIYATFNFASVVGEALKAGSIAGAPNQNFLWPALVIRTIVLLPIFAAFGVVFSQYKKERDFEEEYAHKAAVATSLPNYGDLTRDPSVRDQIVTGATTVIFTSPTHYAPPEKTEKTLHGATELIEAASKLVSRNR
jgi:hypothetical protein